MGQMETLQEIERRLDVERQALIADTTAKAREAYGRDPYLAHSPTAPMVLQYRISVRAVQCHTSYQALAVISRLGVTFSTEDAEHAVEQLGLIMVHAAVIATMEDLGVDPIIALGRELTKRQDVQPMRAAAVLATAANLFGLGREPRQLALVDGLALAIAKALDDCEIGHGLTIDPLELYRYIGAEVIAGKLSMQIEVPNYPPVHHAPSTSGEYPPSLPDRVTAPGVSASALPPSPSASARVARAYAELQAAANVLDADVNVPVADIQRTAANQAEEPTARHRRPTAAAERACDLVAAELASGAPADAMGAVFTRELAHAEQRAAEGDAFMATVATEGFAAAIVKHKAPVDPATITGLVVPDFVPSPSRSAWGQGPPPGVPYIAPATTEEQRLGVSAATVCPQCAAPMSYVAGRALYRCRNSDPNGEVHEHSEQSMAALLTNGLAAAQEAAIPPPNKLRKA